MDEDNLENGDITHLWWCLYRKVVIVPNAAIKSWSYRKQENKTHFVLATDSESGIVILWYKLPFRVLTVFSLFWRQY